MKPKRNKKVDWQKSVITGLSVGSWIITLGVLLLIDAASPVRDNLFTHVMGGQEQADWNYDLLAIGYVMLVISLFSCILAFVFNFMHFHKNGEKLKISVIIIGIINLVALGIYTFMFAAQIF